MIEVLGGAALGAFFRLLYGGAPHVATGDNPFVQHRGWLGKGPSYLLFWSLGVVLLTEFSPWSGLLGPMIVSAVLALCWNPGHGSYLNPGNGSRDNEILFKEIVPWVAGGQKPGSVWYQCAGMGVRYGWQTGMACVAMGLCNRFLGTDFELIYGAVGLLAAPIMLTLWAVKWHRFRFGGWINPQFHNGPFEIAIGALLYGTLALA